MEMPKPSEAHDKLTKLVGSWSGEEKMHPSPWDPQGGIALGLVENRSALDGFTVIQDYVQERDGQTTFKGHGVFSYDSHRNEYVLHWWDTMGMPPNVFRGNFTGEALVLTSDEVHGQSRATCTVKGNRYTFKMEVSQDGKQWQTFMEGDYTKNP